MLELPQNREPFASQINDAIQRAVAAGKSELVLSEGCAGIDAPIAWPRTPFRLIGSGVPEQGRGTRLERITDVTILDIVGENRGNDPTGMVQSPRLESLRVDGRGFSKPLVRIENAYQGVIADLHTEGWFVNHITISNWWDSRLYDGTCVGGGMCDCSAPPRTRDEQYAGFALGVPMVDVISPNQHGGNDTANNIYWRGWRFESQPNNAVFMLLRGNNGVMHTFHACKWEGFEGNRPMLVALEQSALVFSGCWMMGGGSGAPMYDLGGIPAGTKYAQWPHPGVMFLKGCRGIYGAIIMAYHDGKRGETVSSLAALVRIVECDNPELSVYAIQGLSGIDPAGGLIHASRCTEAEVLRAKAQPWAWGAVGGNGQRGLLEVRYD